MGACQFTRHGYGKTDREAYEQACDEALSEWEMDHEDEAEDGPQGYSGNLDSKDGYVMTNPPDGISPREWMRLIEDFDPKTAPPKYKDKLHRLYDIYDDKRGPALCIKLKEGDYIFFGYAPE